MFDEEVLLHLGESGLGMPLVPEPIDANLPLFLSFLLFPFLFEHIIISFDSAEVYRNFWFSM